MTSLRCFAPAAGDMLGINTAGGHIAGVWGGPNTDEVIE